MFNTRTQSHFFEHHILNAKNMVIVGDGPIAYAQAIALKNLGLDVKLVGPRLGLHTRSGDFRPKAVTDAINALIFPEKIIDTPSRHLKDLERQLNEIALKLKIPLIRQKFTGFIDNKTIEITDENNNKSTLQGDLFYDATGPSHALLKKINEIHPHTFNFESEPNNPHYSYAQVRVIMSEKEINTFQNYPWEVVLMSTPALNQWQQSTPNTVYLYKDEKNKKIFYKIKDVEYEVPSFSLFEKISFDQTIKTLQPCDNNEIRKIVWLRVSETSHINATFYQPNPEVFLLGMEKLEELGWTEPRLPNFYGNSLPKKVLDPKTSSEKPKYIKDHQFHKFNIYTEIPESMMDCKNKDGSFNEEKLEQNRKNIEKFVNVLFQINTNELKPYSLTIEHKSQKYTSHKPMITLFRVDPTFTTPGYYLGDKNIPTVLMIGDGICTVPFYMGQGVIAGARGCRLLNEALFIDKDNKIVLGFDKKLYRQYFQTIQRDVKRAIQLLFEYNNYRNQISQNRAGLYYQKSFEVCQDLQAKKHILTQLQEISPAFFVSKITSYEKSLTALNLDNQFSIGAAMNYLKNISPIFIFKIASHPFTENELITMDRIKNKFAEQCKKVGNKLPKTQAVYLYKLALETLENSFKPPIEDIIILYSNLIITQKENPHDVVQLASKVQQQFEPLLPKKVDEQKSDKVPPMEKIIYHKALALINIADTQLSKNKNITDSIIALLTEIKEIIRIGRLKIYDAIYREIEKQYEALENKYNLKENEKSFKSSFASTI